MDATRVCLRLGAEHVSCVYRRSKAECPARAEEVHHAEQEGVEFHWLTNPVEARIQEVHLLTLHCLCDIIDYLLLGE